MINVILSTYNEAENIVPMLKTLSEVLKTMLIPYKIIVVDGNSPDGTAEIANRHCFSNVLVIKERCKSGLGNSYLEGLKHCIYDYTVILDADFQHDPYDIPRMYNAHKQNPSSDIVTGTRYAQSGMVTGWPFKRKFISLCANNIARYSIGLKTSDLTSSFRCYRTEVAKKLFPQVRCKGFGFQMEVIARAESGGFVINEIPITFYSRTAGESKLSSKEMVYFCFTILLIYLTT